MLNLKRTVFVSLSLGIVMFIFAFANTTEPQPYVFSDLKFFPKMPQTTNVPTIEGVALGRYLFYDSILSQDFSFSCASCHQQNAAFSDGGKRFSEGINGSLTERNTLPLFNLAWYETFFWDGRANSIETQVFHPVSAHDEMNLKWGTAVKRISESSFYRPKFEAAFGEVEIDSVLVAMAIAQFERTLISSNSRFDRVLRGEAYLSPEEYEGFELMNDQTKGDCLHCHITDANALGTTGKFSNNALDAAQDKSEFKDRGKGGVSGIDNEVGQFKIPSLRNLSFTAPYMHDGRFETLDEVLNFYSEGLQSSYTVDSKMGFVHQGGAHLSQEEKKKIIAFLLTLNDSTFILNPNFSNPFASGGSE